MRASNGLLQDARQPEAPLLEWHSMVKEELFPRPWRKFPSIEDWQPNKTLVGCLVVFITAVALLLRCHAISAKSFWLEEGFSVELVRLPWADFLRVLWHREANMTLLLPHPAILARDGFVGGFHSRSFGTNFRCHCAHPLKFWRGGSSGPRPGCSQRGCLPSMPITSGTRRRPGPMPCWCFLQLWRHGSWSETCKHQIRRLGEPTPRLVCCSSTATSTGGLLVLGHGLALSLLTRDQVPWTKLVRCLLWFRILVIPVGIFVVMTGTGPVNWIPPVNGKALLAFFCRVRRQLWTAAAYLVCGRGIFCCSSWPVVYAGEHFESERLVDTVCRRLLRSSSNG